MIEVRRCFEQARQIAVYGNFTSFVECDRLFFPVEVVGELRAGADPKKTHEDRPLNWAKSVESLATKHGPPLSEVSEIVLPRVGAVLDVSKTTNVDEADPYLAGLALLLMKRGDHVTVITEDRRDKPVKMSLST